MFCINCGKELPDGQTVCPYCGASTAPSSGDTAGSSGATPPPSYSQPAGDAGASSYSPPPGGGTTPPSYAPPPPGGDNRKTLDLIIKIISGICAVCYVFMAGGALLSFIGSMRYVGFFGFLRSACTIIVAIWMVVVFVMTILRRRTETNNTLFAALCLGAVVELILRLIFGILIIPIYHIDLAYGFGNLVGTLFRCIIWHVVSLGILFGLLYAMGEPPFMGKSMDEIRYDVLNGLSLLLSSSGGNAGQSAPNYRAPAGAQGAPNYQAPTGGQGGSGYQPQPSYQSPTNPGTPPGQFVRQPLKTDRSLVLYIILAIVTCGIYSYYFLYAMARDVNIVCEGDGKKTPGLLAFILLSFITCGIYAIFWYYGLGNRLAANAPRYNMNFQENGTTILLWYLFGAFLCGIGPFVAMHILIKNTNALCYAYNRYNNL